LAVMLCTVLLLLCFSLFQYNIYLFEIRYFGAHGLLVFSRVCVCVCVYTHTYIHTHFSLISDLVCVVSFICFLGVNNWGHT
jgi:hypothetical protein